MSEKDLLIEDDKLETNLDEINQAFTDDSIIQNIKELSLNDSPISLTNDQFVCEIPKITDPNDLILDLKWKTRDKIILILNEFTGILKGKSTSNREKEKIIETNNQILLTLINLGLSLNLSDVNLDKICDEDVKKSDAKTDKTIKRKINLIKDEKPTELVLELSRKTRIELIENLIKNQNFAITLGDSTLAEIKEKLVEENKAMIKILLDLNVDEIYDSKRKDDEDDEAIGTEDDESTASFLLTRSKISKQISILEKKLDDLHQQVDYLKDEKFKETSDIHKSETVFTYKLTNLDEFFQKPNNCRRSEPFYAAGIPWCIFVQTVDKNPNRKILSFCLKPLNTFDNYIDWSCKTYYELRILSGSPYIDNKIKQCLKTFSWTGSLVNGYMDFCLSEDINNLAYFIRNNALYLQCYLKKAEKIIRTSF